MKRILWFTALAVVVVFGALFVVKTSLQPKDPYDAVPINATLILELPQTGALFQLVENETVYWPEIREIDFLKALQNDLSAFDSLLNYHSKEFRESFALSPSVCVMLENEQDYGFVFIVKVDNGIHKYDIPPMAMKAFGANVGVIERDFGNYNTATLVDKRKNGQLNYCITNGLLIAGYDRKSFESALLQLENPEKLSFQPDFSRLKATGGKQADAFVYLQPDRLRQLLQNNASENYKTIAALLAQRAGSWASFDIAIKSNELLLNGFILPRKSDVLAALSSQEPIAPTLFGAIPFDTRLFLHFGWSNLNDALPHFTDSTRVKALSAHAQLDLNHSFVQQLSGEMALGFRPGNKDDKVFFVAVLKDTETIQNTLELLSRPLEGTPVRRITDPLVSNMLSTLLGSAFSSIFDFHYVVSQNLLIVGNNVASVEQVVHLNEIGRSLANNENFKAFSNNLSSTSNVLLVGNIREGLDLLNTFFDTRLGYHINRNRRQIENFEAFALQLSAAGELVYSSLALKYNPDYQETGSILWQVELDAPASGEISLVSEPSTDKKIVLAFDEENKMYAFSAEGRLLWKKQISGAPLGEVQSFTYAKGKQHQLLFNSKSHLYAMDFAGNVLAGFPVRLQSEATNSLCYAMEGGNGEGRIFVSASDKRTYAFDVKGNEVRSWDKPRSLDFVTRPVQHFAAGNMDYVVITDASDEVRVLNWEGNQRISSNGNINKSQNADFYLNKTNSKGVLISTNKEGKLLYISGSGLTSTTDFGNYSANHFFLYSDFDQNRSNDFIYLDGKNIQIFDRFRKVLFTHAFKNEILTQPVFYPVSRGRQLLCVVDESAEEVYLIDEKGRMSISSGLRGELPFVAGNLQGNDDVYLVSATGKKVICYQVF